MTNDTVEGTEVLPDTDTVEGTVDVEEEEEEEEEEGDEA
jgi:hypothetical protein